jgi:hypothetical protein
MYSRTSRDGNSRLHPSGAGRESPESKEMSWRSGANEAFGGSLAPIVLREQIGSTPLTIRRAHNRRRVSRTVTPSPTVTAVNRSETPSVAELVASSITVTRTLHQPQGGALSGSLQGDPQRVGACCLRARRGIPAQAARVPASRCPAAQNPGVWAAGQRTLGGLEHDRQEEADAGSGKKAAFSGCETLPALSFDCFGRASRATCFDGDLHSTFHRIFEGHLDSEQFS